MGKGVPSDGSDQARSGILENKLDSACLRRSKSRYVS